ncbi:hypothetical protein NCS57_00752000 [Fusarium keratoplasticum]|uniref:Uncharacterized protein n=1 Tax=Fusarium keratoplasticum TaxID=1328300 RepID=A0ACC0QXY0_9HYPO|nr:hypothetical protein NCS57_00752000 [Fusarium keratoplasticum]KAI8669370.1 hypothetical protein NCS57_00752000 [Fusarium keratoplasticum]KAI8673970.1 hypothetical protein NCS55_00719600 [Fusarium keratoplasticum]
MGVTSRKSLPLPAPTETETTNTTPTELTTGDEVKPDDGKSSYSIPEDGTPVTIATRHKASKSQTSLLIEYFEGGKPASGSASERRPSVRVRLTPSKRGRNDHHLQVTETKGTRNASVTRRIPLDLHHLDYDEDGNSMSSYASATEESNVSRNPIDIEIDRSHRRRRPASPLIPSESYTVNPSEISAIPSDSFLDGDAKGSLNSPTGTRDMSSSAVGTGALAAAAVDEIKSRKSRNRDRSKVSSSEKSREKSTSERKRRPKSRTSSVTERTAEELKSPRRRSSKSHQESVVSGADTSVLSSNLSPSHRTYETHSTRSGASKASSINNPKLLETVEDAIRRLILPELSALKREQSKREGRRDSFTSSGTSVSRDEFTPDRRRSSGQRSDIKAGRNREARHELDDSSLISNESVDQYDDHVTPKRSGDLLKSAAIGAAAASSVTAASSLLDDKSQTSDLKPRERRRRKAEAARSRSMGRDQYSGDYDDAPVPPMPLMSEINGTELTRTSIRSADTDRPHSATEEITPLQNVSHVDGSDSDMPTPTRSPNLESTLSTQHANVSHGDLTALPRGKKEYIDEYETDEYGNKVPIDHGDQYGEDDGDDISDVGEFEGYDNSYFATQDVPPPLKYVPYQAGARGLSPIPSVSGYTEGGSEHQPRNSRSMHSTSDAYYERSENPRNSRSTASLSSIRARELEQMSPRSSGMDYRNTTYTDDSGYNRNTTYTDDSELEKVTSGQAVQGVGATNPNIVHPPLGVESAVASLVDGSMLDQSVLTGASYNDYNGGRDSTLSYDEQSRTYSSRGLSPGERYTDNQSESSRHATPSAVSRNRSPREFTEYELDEHGRKVVRPKSPTAAEVAITSGAVLALKAAQGKKQAAAEGSAQGEFQPAGVARNKSFKERTLEGHEPRNTPAHSIDRLSYEELPKMSATGVPDFHDPMPEIGYVDDDAHTNPSVVQERLDGEDRGHLSSGRATPTPLNVGEQQEAARSKSAASSHGPGAAEIAGAAALGAAAGMAAGHGHSREPSHDHDEWRSSDDRKRDTLVTNPYEDASPIANPALNENLLGARGLNASYGVPYHTGSPGFGQKYDEGYMSNGNNRTPDLPPKVKPLSIPGSPHLGGDDPFYAPMAKDARHLSGMSQGMASPFYDAATGQGIDRIENKDIVALMQHLMVRDAQRSARDTEIVALLMNSALEMRTSLNELKNLVQDTSDDVIFAGVENTEKLQRAINGPRPYPGPRSIQSSSQLDTLNEAAAKKNLFKRALQGLSNKGTSDFKRIEEILIQILGEVDVLKTQTAPPVSTTGGRGSSFDNLHPEGHYEQDRGYEPEGNSTITPSQSGHLSLSQSRSRLGGDRKVSDNRISTVAEHEGEYEFDHPSPAAERTNSNVLTPSRSGFRGSSVPLETPPQPPVGAQPMSNDNTPRTDKSKKHKSGGSTSWLPKFSRWSGTTASSMGKAFRGKKDKYDDFAHSRSASSLGSYDEDGYRTNAYGEDRLHTGLSDQELAAAPTASGANPAVTLRERTMSPGDAPKYKVHRNSLNLQHPQPRQGQTERFRNALEFSAQEYNVPMTPRSADWGGSVSSLNQLGQNPNRYSMASSGGAPRDPEYWTTSPTGPPRPPKEPIEPTGSPSNPNAPRGARISQLAKSSPVPHPSDESGYGTMSGTHVSHYTSSPKPENRNLNAALGAPARRPSGPRAMTPKSPEQEAQRRKRDTFGSVTSRNTDDTETF